MRLEPGNLVRMSQELKTALRTNGCSEHVEEFGECVGVVEERIWLNTPEVNVRWRPSGLRYAYHPDKLENASCD